MAADALSRYPMDAETERGESVLSAVEGGRMCATMERDCRGGDPNDVKP